MRKTTVKNVAMLFGGLLVVVFVLMLAKNMFPNLLEGFEEDQECEPYKTPCPDGMFCENKRCTAKSNISYTSQATRRYEAECGNRTLPAPRVGEIATLKCINSAL